jgi:K+-transporting ATPase KdpF subunit
MGRHLDAVHNDVRDDEASFSMPGFYAALTPAAPFFTAFLRGAAYSSIRIFAGGEYGRSLIPRTDGDVFRAERRARLCLGKTAEAAMSWVYLLSGVLALAIFVYLIVALLFPEKF